MAPALALTLALALTRRACGARREVPGMNIWLRERAPAGGGGGDAQRDAPPPPPPAPPGMVERCAAGCESETTPLGLCLCDAQYEPGTGSCALADW